MCNRNVSPCPVFPLPSHIYLTDPPLVCFTVRMDAMSNTKAWHILRVAANLEQKVSVSLLLDNPSLEIYAPLRTFMVFNRRNRTWTPRIAPLFPGFMFLNIVDPKDLQIRPSRNFFGFMRNASDRNYMKVLDREIARVRVIELGFEAAERVKHDPVRREARLEAQKEFIARSFKELAAIADKIGLNAQNSAEALKAA